MRVLFCKIHCPSFICFCKPSSHIFTPGPLKLESSPHVPSKLHSVPEASDQLPAQTTEVKQNSSEAQQPTGNCVKSSLRNSNSDSGNLSSKQQKKVQWMDSLGKELVEIREFDFREAEDTDFGREQNKNCVCVIL